MPHAGMRASSSRYTLLLNADAWVPVVVGLSILALGTGISALRSETLPKWLGWASVGLGVLAVAGPLGGIAFLVAPLWTLVMGVVLFRSATPDDGTVRMMDYFMELEYHEPLCPVVSRYADELLEGRIIAHKCPSCGLVYAPPRDEFDQRPRHGH